LTGWQSSAGVPSYDLRGMVEALIEVPKLLESCCFLAKLISLGWLYTFFTAVSSTFRILQPQVLQYSQPQADFNTDFMGLEKVI